MVGGTVSRTVNMNSHGTITQGNPAALPASPVAQITSASQYWSTLAANSSTSVANNGQLNFNCASSSALAVFNVNASQMFGSGYQGFALNPSAGTGDVIINIEGSVVNWNSGSFFSQFNTSQWNGRVLFNFFDATSVTLSGLIGGYVVAPNADVTENNNIDGGVMAKDLTVQSEVDLPTGGNPSAWFGKLPNVVSVPEASTGVFAVGALAMTVGLLTLENRSRRKAGFKL